MSPGKTALLSSIFVLATILRAEPEDALLDAKSRDPNLAFLKVVKIPDFLKSGINHDLEAYGSKEARARIIERFRRLFVATGVVDTRQAAIGANNQSVGAIRSVQDRLGGWSDQLAKDAAKPSISLDQYKLGKVLPDKMVIAMATSFAAQVKPGTPTDDQAPPVVVASADPAGLRASQTLPGTVASGPALKDCDIPFDQLGQKCGGLKNGQRCETFSRAQFPEVALIKTALGGVCSATLIADRWLVSAAHCFVPGQSAESYMQRSALRRSQDGAVLRGNDLASIEVRLPYAGLGDSVRLVDYVVVDSRWDPGAKVADGQPGMVANRPMALNYGFPGDMALIKLQDKEAVSTSPAILAPADYDGPVTTAGYGYTTVGNGEAGELWVTWPAPNARSAYGQLELLLTGSANSAFCGGDSGGPAYEGRQRGCPAQPWAPRPRPLIGITSYYYGRQGATPLDSAASCMETPVLRFTNVADRSNRGWICKVTGNQAKGC